jgi:hypothetical protein
METLLTSRLHGDGLLLPRAKQRQACRVSPRAEWGSLCLVKCRVSKLGGRSKSNGRLTYNGNVGNESLRPETFDGSRREAPLRTAES